ncbi:sensor histidine kinase [Microtetraspora malaysiensis]|uniref:sensor histidine kinase n=1 Tax=Microtetraspora malaysiensis TaxID=161358 RepID=UPI00082B6F07|nr:ATP-binding protein [Microtetraspora malaysiensis]
MTFEVTGPEGLPALPAAVEVAAFRIASEAMTNVARHSGATRCRVAVEVGGSFELTVADNGCGTDRTTTRGIGWTSMRERAAELGGSCTISSRPEGRLVVRAVLPLSDNDGGPFAEWLWPRLGMSYPSALGWAVEIENAAEKSGTSGMELFFTLLDEFRAERDQPQDPAAK